LSIQYIFKSGRINRLVKKNKFPKEFFYGYFYLYKRGFNVDLKEEDQIGITRKNSLFFRILDKLSILLCDVSLRQIFCLLNNHNLKLLNKSEILIVTTNSLGLTLSLLQRLGFIKKPIMFFVMGLIPLKPSFVKKRIYRFILKNIDLVCISKNEKRFLENIFHNKFISYIPFGVDREFWSTNSKKIFNENYVLAIGNDYSRDWKTLIEAWESDFPNLKLVTSLPVHTEKKNVTVIKGNWGRAFLSDEEIKVLYSNALYVVIPLKETIQPSGQSCCLQAMACGKPVIMSKIKGVWDENLLRDRSNLLFVKPGSVMSLRNTVKEINNNKELQNKLSNNGKQLVDQFYNDELMSKHIESTIKGIIGETI